MPETNGELVAKKPEAASAGGGPSLDDPSLYLNRELAWLELVGKLEARARAAKAEVVDARETERRRTRQKSRGQKVRMIQAKKHRAKHKAKRGHVGGDGWV